ncbi:MAG: transposase [Candidatus Thiodiazotropha sp.]
MRITHSNEIDEVPCELVSHDWAVYAKHRLNHTASVIAYPARYTHRIAITKPVSKAPVKAT